MTFVEKCGAGVDTDYGMRLVRTTSFGRKRVAFSNICIDFGDDETLTALRKRRCFRDLSSRATGKSALEDFPQEILIRILCRVEHADLRSLLLVSKTMRDATVVAKQTHFAYSTPRKTINFEDYEVETPEAPKQRSRAPPHRRLTLKKLVGISVSLFASDHSEEVRPILMEMKANKLIY